MHYKNCRTSELGERLDLSSKCWENPSDCTFPLFNRGRLKTFLKKCKSGEDDHEIFLTVIDQFLSDLPRHLEGIKQAVERQDSEALVKMAHACKGSSRSIGATLLAEISYDLELVGREGKMTDATGKFEQWLLEQERTTHALQQEREQLTSSSLSIPST
jgi:HPt (histidine-containing phosphotransfer) domain-containing protein